MVSEKRVVEMQEEMAEAGVKVTREQAQVFEEAFEEGGINRAVEVMRAAGVKVQEVKEKFNTVTFTKWVVGKKMMFCA